MFGDLNAEPASRLSNFAFGPVASPLISALPPMVVSPFVSTLSPPRVTLPPSRVTTAFFSPCCTSAVVVANTATLSDESCTSWLFVSLSLLPSSILSARRSMELSLANSFSFIVSLSPSFVFSMFIAASFISFALSEMVPVAFPSLSKAAMSMVSARNAIFPSAVSAFSSMFPSLSSLSMACTVKVLVVIFTSPFAGWSLFLASSLFTFSSAVERSMVWALTFRNPFSRSSLSSFTASNLNEGICIDIPAASLVRRLPSPSFANTSTASACSEM